MVVEAPRADLSESVGIFRVGILLIKAEKISVSRMGVTGHPHRATGFIDEFDGVPDFDGDRRWGKTGIGIVNFVGRLRFGCGHDRRFYFSTKFVGAESSEESDDDEDSANNIKSIFIHGVQFNGVYSDCQYVKIHWLGRVVQW